MFLCSRFARPSLSAESLPNARTISRQRLSQRMEEMTDQLNAIERISQNMEREFQSSTVVCLRPSPRKKCLLDLMTCCFFYFLSSSFSRPFLFDFLPFFYAPSYSRQLKASDKLCPQNKVLRPAMVTRQTDADPERSCGLVWYREGQQRAAPTSRSSHRKRLPTVNCPCPCVVGEEENGGDYTYTIHTCLRP